MDLEILGIGCRFPGGANDARSFWHLISSHESALGPMPERGWNPADYLGEAGRPGKSVTFNGGWLRDIDRFDHGFFRISKREAAEMDPQQRLVLEVAHEALHDAGLNPQRLKGRKVGVYVGSGMAEHMALAFNDLPSMTPNTMTGNSLALMANRLSYVLDVDGPSLMIDTACSSAMSALDLAAAALTSGTCELAIVIGVNTMLGPSPFIGFSQATMLSPRGISAPFDESADGFARGEGCGAIVLRSAGEDEPWLSRVYARILGSGTNEDGHTASLSIPNADGQARLFAEVLESTGTAPESVVYVEAHGTGTPVGDPIEAASIASSLVGARRESLPIGSAKGHVGHLETAAGIVGLCKAALCLHHRQLVPTANHNQLSSRIDAEALRIRVPTATEPLPAPESGEEPVIAVCSYGFGGANAFALLAPAHGREQTPVADDAGPTAVLPLSAHYRKGLDVVTDAYATLPADEREEAARWAAAVLPQRRHRRLALPNADIRPLEGEAPGTVPRLLMAFGGQGSHSAEMGRAYYSTFEPYRQALDNADALYAEASGRSLIKDHDLCQANGLSEADQQDIEVTLPAIILTQIAMASLLQAVGVTPQLVIGHSTGEMAAAWHRGALTLAELCYLTHVRAELQAAMRPGAMAAWASDRKAAEQTISALGLEGKAVTAAINAAGAMTLAGDSDAIDSLLDHGKANGIRCTRLPIPRAYHSHHVEEILPRVRERLSKLTPRDGQTAMISSVAGNCALIDGADMGAEYWARNIGEPVDFQGACLAATVHTDLCLEVSPRPVLSGYLGANLGRPAIAASSKSGSPDEWLLDCLGQLFVSGIDIDWTAVQPPKRFVSVPRVPWDHGTPVPSRTWKPTSPSSAAHAHGATFDISLADERFQHLADHRVEGNAVMPGAGFLAMALSLGQGADLTDARFERMLPLGKDGSTTTIERVTNGEVFRFLSNGSSAFSCQIENEKLEHELPIAPAASETSEAIDTRRLYDLFSRHGGLDLAGPFRSIQDMSIDGCQAITTIAVDDALRDSEAVTTVALDGCFQTLAVLGGMDSRFAAPLQVERVSFGGTSELPAKLLCRAVVTNLDAEEIIGDLDLWGLDGSHLARITGLLLRRFGAAGVKLTSGFHTDMQPEIVALPDEPDGEDLDVRSRLQMILTALAESSDPGIIRILDCSENGLAVEALSSIAADHEAPRSLASRILIVMTAPVPNDAPGSVHAADTSNTAPGACFDFAIGNVDQVPLQDWLAPGGRILTVETMLPLPGTAEGAVEAAPQRTGVTTVFFPGGAPAPWTGPEAISLKTAGIVVDDRNDLRRASELLREVSERTDPPGLVFVVKNEFGAAPSSLGGFARAARNEYPTLRIWVLSIAEDVSGGAAWQAVAKLIDDGLGAEFERVFDGQEWHVPRLRAYDTTPSAPTNGDFRLDIERPGQLSTLFWRPIRSDLESLKPHEVRLRVRFVSLNFKDVMLAMGLLDGFKLAIGMECSGEIVEIGRDAQSEYPDLAIGSQVVCISLSGDVGLRRSSLFGETAAVDARSVFLRPDTVPEPEAAGFLSTYATAWHALNDTARLREGETVLIHSAAGGVGQAALHIARELGADVIASAGSEDRRDYLRETCGIAKVIDSHAPENFVDEVMRLTDGRGVDVTLNAISGEGLRQTLHCIAPTGRHVEIGKRDILEDQSLGLLVLKNNITFHSVHLDMLDETHPDRVRGLIETCLTRLSKGEAKTTPTQIFPAYRTHEAFRLLSAGKHIGKLVVDLTDGIAPSESDAEQALAVSPIPDALFGRDETQLITGGTGGLGVALARFMAERGVGRILLASRSGKAGALDQLRLDGLRSEYPDCRIDPIALDVTDPDALSALFAQEPSIAGIFHAATTYKAEASTDVTGESLETWKIKVDAAWNLHRLSKDLDLRHFVLITSLAGLHGNVNQAVYVASNAALGELARQRRTEGLTALAIDLPVLLGAGRLSQAQHLAELDLNTGRGFGAVSFSDLVPTLEQLLADPDAHPEVVSLDRPNWASYLRLNRHRQFYEHLVSRADLVGNETKATSSAQLDRATIEHEVCSKIAFVLGADISEIEPDIPLIELGVDSLAAIELMNWLNKTYNATLSQTQILSGASARTMVDAVADSGLVSDEAPSEVDIVPVLDEPLEPMPVVPVSTPSPAAQPTPEIREAPAIVAIEPAQPNEGFVDVPLEPPPILVAGHREVIVPAKLRGDTMDRLLADLADTRQPIVLRRDPNEEHFCIGMDLEAANFGDQSMSAGLEQYEKLAALMNDAEMPIIALIDGACRGGGMLFPSLATIVIATDEASFGFPEIRVGGLPGLVSVYAQNRLSRAACQRYMLTGDVLDPESAYRAGLVDFIGDADASEKELQRHLRRFQTIDPQLLTEARQALPAETPELAMIAMGGLDRRAKDRERDERPLVRLMHQPSSGVAIIELNDPDFSNAIDWAIGDDLAKAIRAAKKLDPLRSVVLQGSGEHFCVGVNPYNFIRRTKQLPVLTAARVVHDIYHAFLSVRDLGVPVVCALHGKVMGGGMAAALIGDYRIAAADALFNYGNLPRGVCPGMTMSESLARNVGQAWATELYMNDFTLSADEAKAIGLINDVATDAAEAKLTALDLATRIAGYAPTGVRATTALMRPTVDPDRLARESVGIARCNIQGNAFAPGWKAEERRLGDAAISQKVAALTATPPSPGSGETSKVGLVVPPQQWDWDSEVRLDLTLGRERQRTSDRGECIFLTGATGFVGVFILSELLRRPNSTIVCLVRADTNDHARERVIAKLKTYGLWEERFSHRIEALAGDVGHTDLGLGEDVYSRLAERCDVVLHNGAMVDFTLELDALKRTNVEGVRNICRFAAAGVRSQLVHVSSLSVFSLYRFDGEATDLRPDPARLINGYARSKWLGEQIALLAWRQGLDVSVVRPGRVMGDGESGASNVEDWFTRYLISSIAMGIAWQIDHETDMSPVDAVARLIVSRVGEPVEARCWHAYSPVTLSAGQIADTLRGRGYSVRDVPYETWMETLTASTNQAMLPLAQTFKQLPIKANEGVRITFSSDLPEPDRIDGTLLLNRMLDWLIAEGTLPQPGGPAHDNVTSLPPRMAAAAESARRVGVGDSQSRRVGIHAMELYFPPHTISQAEMERFHECPGKYTAGLGQEAITFCADNEDAVSMALTAVHRLIERTGIGWDQIGRLEVGTESLVDRSKGIKTILMSLFEKHGNCDIEGVDNYTACYGGTAALLNSVSWCQSEAWDGRYALVVAVDIADLDSHQAFLNGAAAVAMLVGPDAPVRLEPERATHMMNTWDFYKPVGWKDSFPLMRDGKHSIDVYMACLEGCYRGLSRKLDTPNLLSIHDYAIFHCTSTYLCKRAFDRLAGLASPELGLRDRNALYQSMAAPGTLLTKQIGSTYTASCYVNLYSLLHTLGEQAVGKKILAFSYGSGAASSMFRLSVDSLPDLGHKLDQRLAARIAHVPQDFIALTEAYSNAYARFDFKPSERSDLKEGVYYLDRVDRWGLRHYSRFANGQKQALCSGSPLERVLYETDAESTMDVVRTEEMPVA